MCDVIAGFVNHIEQFKSLFLVLVLQSNFVKVTMLEVSVALTIEGVNFEWMVGSPKTPELGQVVNQSHAPGITDKRFQVVPLVKAPGLGMHSPVKMQILQRFAKSEYSYEQIRQIHIALVVRELEVQ
jgi:hypothetical protein